MRIGKSRLRLKTTTCTWGGEDAGHALSAHAQCTLRRPHSDEACVFAGAHHKTAIFHTAGDQLFLEVVLDLTRINVHDLRNCQTERRRLYGTCIYTWVLNIINVMYRKRGPVQAKRKMFIDATIYSRFL
jgi:hypothetical protein